MVAEICHHQLHHHCHPDLAQRRFMLVDPNNRLVADRFEGEWNDSYAVLADAHEDRERAKEHNSSILDKAVRVRLAGLGFNKV